MSLRRSIAATIARLAPLRTAHGAYWRARVALERRVRHPLPRLAFGSDGPEPSFANPTSQLCTAAQCLEPDYALRCREIQSAPRFNRKQWEFAYILQVLHVRGLIRQGARGLGFGCGKEPIPAALAAQGCTIVATDQPAEAAAQAGWIAGEQHAATLDALNDRGLCASDQFRSLVSLREVDMNAIPPDLRGFDFVWSACSLEHLGSLRRGLDFIHNSVKCLKPGGVAVHTTEFNLSSLDETLEDPNCVVYRRCDIEQLVEELRRDGHAVAPVSFDPGGSPPDRYVDVPPYRSSPHLKLRLEKYVVTSIGLIVQAGEFT